MADYKAGDLNLTIQTISNDTIKSLDAVIERLSLINRGLGGIKGSSYIRKSAKTPKSNGGVFGFAKIGISLHLMRRMGRFMANLVQSGSDYIETLNLWQVAMQNNLDVADKFVNKMQKAYGISTKTLMNAQATFKNMIGSLGQISDETAYALSESLVQMSADFASLYNVSIESAFEKMQSMLAGQVRPIRSAGLDITETTLYQFYQQIGGTKTMRQLNRTEKQLLSILAVYQQMGSAGALGDMTKTLNLFANQSRMMTEYWAELKIWSGLFLKDLIDQSGLLIKINALLITATEIIKAIAKSRGLGDKNFINGILETTEDTNDEVDELQGKLLDFDKFRSLEGAGGQTNVEIDEKLLEAINGYSSKIDEAENWAKQLADSWGKILGFTINANGEWEISEEKLSSIENTFKAIGITIGIIVGLKLVPWLFQVATNAIYAGHGFNVLGYAILGGAIYAILQAIDAFERADYWGGVLYSVFGVALVGAFIALNKQMLITAGSKIIAFFQTLQLQGALAVTTMQKMQVVMSYVGVAVMAAAGAFMIFDGIISGLEGNAKRTVSIISIVVGSLTTLLGVILAIKGGLKGGLLGASIAGLGVGALLAGIKGVAYKETQSLNNIPNYEMGASDIDSGTIFRAGEFGKTEAVYTGSNGKTNVANVQQMKAAFYSALVDFSKSDRSSDERIIIQIDGENVFQATRKNAKRRGLDFAKV